MPNPIGKPFPSELRTWIQVPSPALGGTDSFFGAAGQPPTYDFPNPRGKLYPSELRSFTCGLMLGLIAAALPNVQQHVPPNPTGKIYAQELRTFVNPAETQLIGKDVFFGAAGETQARDFPNPTGKVYPSDLRTFTNNSEIQLIGQDAFFGLAGCPVFDQPNPRGKAYPSDLRTFVNPAETQLFGQDQFFAAAGMGPNYDYPNPRNKQFASDLRNFTLATSYGLVAASVPATISFDFPNPRGKSFVQTAFETSPPNNIVFVTPVVYPSTFVFDFPNPRGKLYSQELRTFVNAAEIQLIGQDKFFGVAGEPPRYDFPNPQIRKASLSHISQLAGNLLGTTLVGGFVPNPYYTLLLNNGEA